MAMRIKLFLSLVIVILVVVLFVCKWIDNQVKNGNSLIIKIYRCHLLMMILLESVLKLFHVKLTPSL